MVAFNVASLVANLDRESVIEGGTDQVNLLAFIGDTIRNPTSSFSLPTTSDQGGAITDINTARGTFTLCAADRDIPGHRCNPVHRDRHLDGATATGTVAFTIATIVANTVNTGVLEGASRDVDLAPAVQDVTKNPTFAFSIPSTSAKGGAITDINTAKGTFTYTPANPTFTGTDTLTYTVTDQATHASSTSVIVFAVASLIADPFTVGVLENESHDVSLERSLHDVSTNPYYEFSIPTTSDNGGKITNIDASTGTFTYTPPNAGYIGSDDVRYTVTDLTTGATTAGVVYFNVATLVAKPVGVGVFVDTSHTVDLGSAVLDVRSNPTLSFAIPARSDQGGAITKIDATKGTFTYTPPSAGFLGTNALSYTVTDLTTHVSTTATVVFDVATLVANPVSVNLAPGTSGRINLGPAVEDVTKNPSLEFSLPTTSAQGGEIYDVSPTTGSFTYSPPTTAFRGTDTLTYQVTDTVTHATATATITIQIQKTVPPAGLQFASRTVLRPGHRRFGTDHRGALRQPERDGHGLRFQCWWGRRRTVPARARLQSQSKKRERLGQYHQQRPARPARREHPNLAIIARFGSDAGHRGNDEPHHPGQQPVPAGRDDHLVLAADNQDQDRHRQESKDQDGDRDPARSQRPLERRRQRRCLSAVLGQDQEAGHHLQQTGGPEFGRLQRRDADRDPLPFGQAQPVATRATDRHLGASH